MFPTMLRCPPTRRFALARVTSPVGGGSTGCTASQCMRTNPSSTGPIRPWQWTNAIPPAVWMVALISRSGLTARCSKPRGAWRGGIHSSGPTYPNRGPTPCASTQRLQSVPPECPATHGVRPQGGVCKTRRGLAHHCEARLCLLWCLLVPLQDLAPCLTIAWSGPRRSDPCRIAKRRHGEPERLRSRRSSRRSSGSRPCSTTSHGRLRTRNSRPRCEASRLRRSWR